MLSRMQFVRTAPCRFVAARGHTQVARALSARRRTLATDTSSLGSKGQSFRQAIAGQRVLLVAGGTTSGRTRVSAAAAVALSRSAPTLLVDADDPQHGLGDQLGLEGYESSELPRPVAVKVDGHVGDLKFARLSRIDTLAFLERLMGTSQWRKMIATDGAGAKVAAAMGVPVEGMLGVLDALRPLPGAEMPVALARLLSSEPAKHMKYVVVDAGAAGLAAQFQSIPPVVADGLAGLLQLQGLLAKAKNAVLPGTITVGMRMLVGSEARFAARAQLEATNMGLDVLRTDMAHLAGMERAVLLVTPRRPGMGGVQGAIRMVDRLQPSCVALTWNQADGELPRGRPRWLKQGPAAVTLPLLVPASSLAEAADMQDDALLMAMADIMLE